MKRGTALGLGALVALACTGESPGRENTPSAATPSQEFASENGNGESEPSQIAAAGFASATSSTTTAFPFLQDTARTVTRRIWAEADLGSVSPDGRYASVTEWEMGDLAIRDLETGEVRRLTHNPGEWEPGFADGHLISRDGEWVAVSWYEWGERGGYRLGVVPTRGGDLRFIGPSGGFPLDWSWNSEFILAHREVGPERHLFTISTGDGSVQVLKAFHDTAPTSFPYQASFSPDGRFVAYAFPKPGRDTDWDIFTIDVETGRESVIVESPAFDGLLGWAPDGDHILFQSDRGGTPGAWLVPVAEGRAIGEPWLVKPDLWRAQGLGFVEDGRYFYTVETGKRDVFVATLAPDTRRVVGSATSMIPRSLGDGIKPRWSPDGTYLAYAVETGPVPMQSWPWSPQSVVIQSLETGAIKELGLDVSGTPRPSDWTPDGRGIFVVTSNLNDPEIRNALYRVDVQTGDLDTVFTLGHDHALAGLRLSPDGRALFVAGAGPPWDEPSTAAREGHELRSYKLVRMELGTESFTELFRTPPGGPGMIRGLRASHDGQTLAFGYCPRGGPDRLVILPTQGGDLREVVQGTFSEVAWMPDGEGLLAYGSLEGQQELEVYYVDLADGGAHPIGISGEDLGFWMDVHPDGDRVVYSTGRPGIELWVMENFLPGSEGPERAGASSR